MEVKHSRVTFGGTVSFLYLELTAANRAFWRGQVNEAKYELASLNLRDWKVAGEAEKTRVTPIPDFPLRRKLQVLFE